MGENEDKRVCCLPHQLDSFSPKALNSRQSSLLSAIPKREHEAKEEKVFRRTPLPQTHAVWLLIGDKSGPPGKVPCRSFLKSHGRQARDSRANVRLGVSVGFFLYPVARLGSIQDS
jgi:hypothetical protein